MKLLLATVLVLVGHGQSRSFADWTLTDAAVEGRITFKAHDLLAAEPWLDADNDGQVAESEADAGAARLTGQLLSELRVSTGSRNRNCKLERAKVVPFEDPVTEFQLAVRFVCLADEATLTLSHHHLQTLEPPHVTHATISNGAQTSEHVFAPQTRQLIVRRPVRSLSNRWWLLAIAPVWLWAMWRLWQTRKRGGARV